MEAKIIEVVIIAKLAIDVYVTKASMIFFALVHSLLF